MRLFFLAISILFVFGVVNIPGVSKADFSVNISVSPPALPIYVQPAPPASNYIWAPGYWAYDSYFTDYYWVPGTWVQAPYAGLLWTPGYWGWRNGYYSFNDGYWGANIGFYGGINYGHGYGGSGNSTSSFNGGPGGTNVKPTFAQQAAMKEKHIPATSAQNKQVQAARNNPALRASANHGKPAITATERPGVFKSKGVVSAHSVGASHHKKTSTTSHGRSQPVAKKHIVQRAKPKVSKPDHDDKPKAGSGN